MATSSPCALPYTSPCGCWRLRRTVRGTPLLADAGDADEQSVRFVDLHSLRMLAMAKDEQPVRLPNTNPCGCWRWRRADRVPPVLADAGDADQQPMRFGELQSLRMLEISKDSPLETPLLADARDGDEQSVRFAELQSLRMLEMAKDSP